MPQSRRISWWLCLPALLAIAVFWPTLAHGWRSDDFLIVYYLDRDAEVVRWGRVVEEWVRPWFGVRDLYRPLVSLSYGLNWAFGTSPVGFHLLNVLLLAGTATCVAATAARLARVRPALVGLVAGAVVVLHPAAVEPTAWIAARTTGLQVFWSAVALWSFLRWRQGDGGFGWHLLAMLLACASKEGAVLLPVGCVVISLLLGERLRWRSHAAAFALVGGYLVFRKLLLGWFTTAEDGHTIGGRFAGALELGSQLLVPPLGGGWHLGGVFFALLFVFLAATAIGSGNRRALWCLPWALLLLLPGTTHVAWQDGLLLGRFVFDAVPALALFVALAVERRELGRLAGVGRWVALLALFAGLVVAHRVWLVRYGDEAAKVAQVQQALLAVAKDAGPGRPFGVAALPGQPSLQPGLWGLLAQRPFAPVDLSVSGLFGMLEEDPGNPLLRGNASPVHALVMQGAGFAGWQQERGAFVSIARPERPVVELLRNPQDPRQFVPPGLLSPAAFGVIEVRNGDATVNLRPLGVLAALDSDPTLGSSFDPPPASDVPVHWFDTSDVVSWYVMATLGGGPLGVELTSGDVDTSSAVRAGATVHAHAEFLVLSDASSVPARCTVAEFAQHLRPPTANDTYTLFVYSPFGVLVRRWSSSTAELGALPAGAQATLRFAADVLGSCTVHWCWQGEHQGRPARTPFGIVEVR